MTIGKKIIPNLIGIDIGCGITLAQIKGKKIEYQKLDTVIRDSIPSDLTYEPKLTDSKMNLILMHLDVQGIFAGTKRS